MANETTLLIQTGLPIPFTCADGTAIAKGAILRLTDPMTASINGGTDQFIAGIAASEKIASDGTTQIGVYREGIFRGYASGSISVGDSVGTLTGYVNFLASNVNTGLSGSKVVGIALETATNGETFKFELRPGFVGGSIA